MTDLRSPLAVSLSDPVSAGPPTVVTFTVVALMLWLSALSTKAFAAADIRPGDDWRTVRNERIAVHYRRQAAAYVPRVWSAAEQSYAALEEWTKSRPRTVVHLVIVDEHDITNGMTTPIPRNAVRLYVLDPRPPSGLDEYDDWLTLLVMHEMVHVFHLDSATGLARVERWLFGRVFFPQVELNKTVWPLVFPAVPNGLLPDTLIEGYAVWGETVLTGTGRAGSTTARSVVRNLARDGALPRLGSAVGQRRAFPGGSTPYLLGGALHRWLSVREQVDVHNVYRRNSAGWFPGMWFLPFWAEADNLPAATWNEWRRHEQIEAAEFDAHRATLNEGRPWAGPFLAARAPWYGPDGTFYLSVRDGHRHDRVVAVTDDGTTRSLFRRSGGNGFSMDATGAFWFDGEYIEDSVVRTMAVVRRDRRGKIRRAGGTAHAFEPDARAGRVVWVERHGPSYCLVVLDLRAGTRWTNCGSPFVPMWLPRLSPDGTQVAYVTRSTAGRSDLALWSVTGAHVDMPETSPDDTWFPQWAPDGRSVYAVRTLDGQPELYRFDLTERAWFQVTRTRTGVHQFALAPDGRRFAYLAPGKGGWRLYAAEISAAEVPARAPRDRLDSMVTRHEPPHAPLSTTVPDDTPYRAARTLLPLGWIPRFHWSEAGRAGGFYLVGEDVLGGLGWSLEALVDERGVFDGAAVFRGRHGKHAWAVSLQGFPAGRSDDPHKLRARAQADGARIWKQTDISGSLGLRAAVERAAYATPERPRAELAMVGAIDTRQIYAYSLTPVDGVLVRTVLGAAQEVGSDALYDLGLADGRAEGVASGGLRLWRGLALRAEGAAGAHSDDKSPLGFQLRAPSAGRNFDTRRFVGRGVPTPSGGATAWLADRFALWDVGLAVPLGYPQFGFGALPLYLDSLSAWPYLAGAWWRTSSADLKSRYVGVEAGADFTAAWLISLPMRYGMRWNLEALDATPERYFTLGFSLALGAIPMHGAEQ